MKHLLVLIAASLVLLLACDQKPEKGPLVSFDLAGFMDSEKARISGRTDVIKTVTLNGTTETRRMEGYTWTSEFDLLKQWDINRPAWRDRYQRDTTRVGDQILYRYQGLDEDLQVQRMDVWMTGDRVDSLQMTTRVDNPLRTTEGRYIYSPSEGLRMNQVSSKRFGSDQDLSVTVRPVGTAD